MKEQDGQSTLIEVITAFRNVIHSRYDYNRVKDRYDIPDSFTEDKFDDLRAYFLTHIYPPPAQRAQLNEAFDKLENHIGNPKYLLNVLMDSVSILFKYGRHLPKILRTGLKAMQSFKKANRFEHQLAAAAEKSERKTPFSQADIEYFASQLSESEVYGFIDDSLGLFETLHDRQLVKRVIDIVNHLISKMLDKPNVYPRDEVAALELGRDLIVEGNQLFSTLTDREQKILFDMIVRIEKDELKAIFS